MASHYWFINVGERRGENRDWDDNRKYGFISAGQGKIYSDSLRKLEIGDTIFAYLNRYRQGIGGYVGFGEVISQAVMAKEFLVNGKKLSDLSLKGSHLVNRDNFDDPELSEYVLGINWIKTFSKDEGKFFSGIFTSRLVVCKLTNQETLKFLLRNFET